LAADLPQMGGIFFARKFARGKKRCAGFVWRKKPL